MSDESNYGKQRFSVTCTWCGAFIRHASKKDSRGMCLMCYARMLNDYSRTYERAERRFKSSER